MLKRILFFLAVLASLPAFARANQRAYGFCSVNSTVTVSGLTATPQVLGNFPLCTVTVYISGTLTLAPAIFSDNSGTVQSNPFTASAGGYWFFYAPNGRYDVQISGGGIPSPFTFGDILLADAGGGGGGGGVCPQGATNSLQKNGGTNCAPSSASDDSGGVHFKGPNPWIDVTSYGARAINTAVPPAAVGLTANCTSGQPTVTISSASTFQNGDGVVVYGCGASQSMSTPGAPTVTPSLPNAATGVGGIGFIVNGPTGGTTYNYQIIARDKNGGLTAASPVGSTTIGASSLGTQSVAITSLTRAGSGVVTVVTSAPHGLSVGAMVHIQGTNNGADFDGWAVTATVADNTHFTFTNGVTTVESATGGNAIWWNCNHLSWTLVTGAWEYYVYGRTGGSLTLLGVSKPNGSYTDTTWDDYGSPMMDGIALPPYVPNTPPSSATSDHLSTTITNGAGTTTLTLATNAGTSISGATIRYDAGPNIAAAAAAASSGTSLYFPFGGSGLSYIVNSYLDLSTRALSIIQVGSFTLNETVALGGTKWYGDRVPPFGTIPQFGFQGNPVVFANTANPGVYLATGNSSLMEALQFSGAANASQLVVVDGGNQISMKDVGFSTGGGSGDYMGVGLNLRSGGLGNSAFGIYLDRILLIAGSQGITSVTPMFICDRCGITSIGNVQASGRSMFFTVQEGGGGVLNIDAGYEQGGVMPFFMTANRGSLGGSYVFKHIQLDTMAESLFSYTGPIAGAPGLTLTQYGPPSGSTPTVTGFALSSFITDNNFNLGQNTNLTVLSGATLLATSAGTGGNMRSGVQVSGALGMGYAFAKPAAPTVVLGGHNSCVSSCIAAGTYFYYISANDANGGYSLSSPASAAATTDGTQTITVSWTLLNGQSSTNIGRSTSSLGGVFSSLGAGVLGTSFVDSSSFFYTISAPTTDTGNSEGISAQGFAGHQSILVDPVGGFSSSDKTATLTANRNVTTPDQSGTKTLGPSAPTTNNVPRWSAPGLLSNGLPVQGTDTSLLSSGPVSGTSVLLCTDANGGATTSGCPSTLITVQSFTNTTLSSDVAVSASTVTTVLTRSVTMPSTGCPCRAFLSYSLYVNTASSGVGYAFWINDGTTNMAGVNTGQSNGTSGGLTSASYGGYSISTYANSANVTFTLSTEGDHTYTVKAAPSTGSAPNSSFQVSIVTSN